MELVVADLACRRAGRRVFADVSFRLTAGEAARLVGPNGAGKSSLLRTLAGLCPLERGSVALGDVDLADADTFRERVAYAGHLDAVKPQLSVIENLRFWSRVLGAADGRAEVALARFALERIADAPAGRCSAGQRRRLGLARLLLVPRPLWLLDEPTVSLDAASAATFSETVREHLAAGGLALVATHAPLGFDAAVEVRLGDRAEGPEAAAPAPPVAADDPFLGAGW